MNNISIADYLKIRQVLDYLEVQKHEKLKDNNGFTSADAEYLTVLIEGLQRIVNKLEKE